MTIAGSPKKLAQDIADGFFSLTPPMLRQFSAGDLKIILNHLTLVTRELRQESHLGEDALAIKQRNTKMSRLNQAAVVIRSYCKKMRIPC